MTNGFVFITEALESTLHAALIEKKPACVVVVNMIVCVYVSYMLSSKNVSGAFVRFALIAEQLALRLLV